jgi:hypothetical protein
MSTLKVNTITDLAGNAFLGGGFVAGTLMLFQQTAAPTGWTKQTTHNDKSLRVVSGNAGSGGSTAFTSVFASRGVPLPEHAHGVYDPGHGHGVSDPGHAHELYGKNDAGGDGSGVEWNENYEPRDGGVIGAGTGIGINGSGTGIGIYNSGTAGASMDFAVQYVDLIIASKS